MALPSFSTTRSPRRRHEQQTSSSSSQDYVPSRPSKRTIKSATRTRLIFSLLTAFLFLVALVFLILVEIGNISPSKSVVGSIYFLKLDVSHVIPRSVPQAQLINSIARSLGLHDFYQVGLWNYCEGYGNEVTGCSKPKSFYWFDPVSIIISELLSGASIALPSTIIDALKLVRVVSHWMFGLFITGACCCFVSIFLTPFSIFTRWATFPIAVFAFLTALFTTVATVIATVMFLIFKKVVQGAEDTVNIAPTIGTKMFAFMWVASACTLLGWIVQMGLCCCCASRRDVQKGKKVGRKKAWRQSGEVPPAEMHEKHRRGLFGRKKQ